MKRNSTTVILQTLKMPPFKDPYEENPKGLPENRETIWLGVLGKQYII